MIRVTDANGNVKTSGPISGSGTTNYLVRWSAALAQQNSNIIDGVASGALTIQKNGTTARTATFPDAAIEVAGVREVVNGSTTARLGATYAQVSTSTFTDPTPVEGRGFEVLVRNGTATIGGTAYATAGAYVRRLYHSGAWSNYVYPHLDAAWTWTQAQTFSGNPSIYSAAGNQQALNIGVSGTQRWAWVRDTGNNFLLYEDNTGAAGSAGTRVTLTPGGNLGIGVTPTASNGLLQLASGTTRANGIAVGNWNLWRVGDTDFNLAPTNGVDGYVRVIRSTGETLAMGAASGVCIVRAASAHPLWIGANGGTNLHVKNNGQVRFLPLSADPAGAETGDVYYNSTTNKLRVYNGAWVDLH